jgi:penicillin V acylase-like amidase (Ntn superfamily)
MAKQKFTLGRGLDALISTEAVRTSGSSSIGEIEISKFFHIMDTLGVPLGCALTEKGEPIRTVYTSCADADDHTYYFTTYECRRIRAVRLSESAMKSDLLTVFPIDKDEDISYLN